MNPENVVGIESLVRCGRFAGVDITYGPKLSGLLLLDLMLVSFLDELSSVYLWMGS